MHRRYREQDLKRSPRHTRHDPESGYTALLYQELARNDAPGLDDAGRLPAVLWLVRCETGDAFLARATAARTESGSSKH